MIYVLICMHMCACVCKCLHMQGHACRDPWTCMTAAYIVTSKRPPPQGGGAYACVCKCLHMQGSKRPPPQGGGHPENLTQPMGGERGVRRDLDVHLCLRNASPFRAQLLALVFLCITHRTAVFVPTRLFLQDSCSSILFCGGASQGVSSPYYVMPLDVLCSSDDRENIYIYIFSVYIYMRVPEYAGLPALLLRESDKGG